MTKSWSLNPAEAGVDGTPTTEQVAAVVSGAGTIGAACNALRCQGWKSIIAGNRITVDDRIFARFIDESVGMEATAAPRWVVYGLGSRPQVWIVGAQSGTK